MVDKSRVIIGEKPVISMDVVDGKIHLVWKTSLLTKSLDHKIDKCVGCSLCLPCPWEAIEMGPVKETASGLIEGAPLVNVDAEVCTYCGLCDSACVFGAFESSYEGESAVTEFNRISGTHKIDEDKCAPCLLCAEVCPENALEAQIDVDKKEDLVEYEDTEYGKGTIKVDEEKCSYCGLCELLCPDIIKIYWSDSVDPPSFRPAIAIRIDDGKCDYCGLCAEICPDEAIEVTCDEANAREIKKPSIEGKLIRDGENCVTCGLCEVVCPFDALGVTKPFSGEVKIVNLEKCDPTGCNNCFNICPVDAIYPTGTKDKIAVLDHCLYCGACEHSCPYDVLEVVREGYQINQLEQARAWEKARGLFFDKVVGKNPPPSDLFEREVSVEPIERKSEDPRENVAWKSSDGEREKAMNSAQFLRDLLKEEKKLYLQLERGRTENIIERLKRRRDSEEE